MDCKLSATKLSSTIFTIFLLLSHQHAASAADDENPFLDMASAFLQNAMQGEGGGGGGFGQDGNGLAALGGLVGSFMQSDGGKKIGDLFAGQGGASGGADMLSSLGTLGSLLSNTNGQIDPAMIGNVISMFAQQGVDSNETPKQEDRRKKRQSEDGLDLGSLLNMASSFLDPQTASNLFPMLLNTIGSFTGPQAQRRADAHSNHAWFLPTYLEQAHVYWDHFINSDLGKSVWERSGLHQIAKHFQDDRGNLDFESALRSLENHSFRRRWIKTATGFFSSWAVHFAQPEVYRRYMSSGQYVVNSFLKSQGFPKNTMLVTGKSAESIGNLVSHVSKRYLNMDADVSMYVTPAIEYLQDIVDMAQKKSENLLGRGTEELSDRITDTLNLEVIEPVLRVYRAYRHSVRAPHCQEHIMCMVNRHHDTQPLGLPGFKAGLTKLSSLIASTVLSYQSGQGFWDLYNAIQNDVNCQAKYPADCGDFHDEEQKVTTEYYHNEL